MLPSTSEGDVAVGTGPGIRVVTLAGTEWTVPEDGAGLTVQAAKEELEKLVGWPRSEQALLAGLRELLDHEVLREALLGDPLQSLTLTRRVPPLVIFGVAELRKALRAGLPASVQDLRWGADDSLVCLDDDDVAELAAGLPSGLRKLSLGFAHSFVGNRGIQALASALPAGLERLRLQLDSTRFGDRGAQALARGLPAALQRLELSLVATEVEDGGIEALARGLPPGLERLQLDLRGARVGETAILALVDASPTSAAAWYVTVPWNVRDARERLRDRAAHRMPQASVLLE